MADDTLAKLEQPDDRTLAFMPLGFGVGLRMSPADSADFWQEVADGFELHNDVAEQTRRSFADVRTAFVYGLFCYEIFTLIHDRAVFVLEQALRDRFLESQNGTLRVVIEGVEQGVAVDSFADVRNAVRSSRGKSSVRLAVDVDGITEHMRFNGGLDDLLRWARRTRLARGQRTATAERVLTAFRNDAAHPSAYKLVTPVDTGRTLSDLAEIIDNLWGHSTPGGRLYPAPLARHTMVVAWNSKSSISWSLAANLCDGSGWESYTDFAFVQGVWHPNGSDLSRYDSVYETTADPTDYLWGPGTRREALSWLREHPAFTDTVSARDRQFAIREHDGMLWLPMTPEKAAEQPAGKRVGHWYLIEADTPTNAFAHVRSLYLEGSQCQRIKVCPSCYAVTVAEGKLRTIVDAARLRHVQMQAAVADFFVPGLGSGIRAVPLG